MSGDDKGPVPWLALVWALVVALANVGWALFGNGSDGHAIMGAALLGLVVMEQEP